MSRKLHALLAFLVFFALSARAAEVVYYPPPETEADRRTEYPVRMLELALAKSGKGYHAVPSPVGMTQGRSLVQVQNGSPYASVVWTMTSKEREQQVLPIRIPIDKGLLGWRLLLVKKGDRNLFQTVRTAGGLFEYTAGLGHDWPDVAVFRSNGLKVAPANKYDLLFRMLASGKFSYFPRSVAEIFSEHYRYQNELDIADHVALYYHAPLYFFVSKDNPALAKAIESGLEKAIKDGSFDRLFNQYYGESIRRAGLEQRTVIQLANPTLPSSTPLDRPALWFRKVSSPH
jgi:hypothetical protein